MFWVKQARSECLVILNNHRQLRMSEESRFTHIRFLLNGAGDVSVPGDDAVMVHDKSSEHTRETIVGSMDVRNYEENDN